MLNEAHLEARNATNQQKNQTLRFWLDRMSIATLAECVDALVYQAPKESRPSIYAIEAACSGWKWHPWSQRHLCYTAQRRSLGSALAGRPGQAAGSSTAPRLSAGHFSMAGRPSTWLVTDDGRPTVPATSADMQTIISLTATLLATSACR